MKPEALQRAISEDHATGRLPLAIVANAGTTNTGAIDPLQTLGEIAAENSIWFHVDGAYGLPGILDEQVSHLFKGLTLADSAIVDPHKWLGASVGIAATFVRDRQILYRAFTQEPADYLEGSVEHEDQSLSSIKHSLDDFGIPYFDFGVELSSPCRGVVVWALIREIGVEGMRQRVKRHNAMARFIAQYSKGHPNLEVLIEPTLSICCFRYVSPNINDLDLFNQRLHRRLVRENKYMPSTTRLKGQLALRPCYVGARADQSQVDGLLEAVLRIGGEMESENHNKH
jgi:aromatic-L-amino-acid decarboxylase